MEYYTNEEIQSGLICELRHEIEKLKQSSTSCKEKVITYKKPPMDFPENYVRYTAVPEIAYITEQNIKTIQSLDTTPDTRRMNVELSNKNMDEVKENLNAAWKDAVNHPSHYCEGRQYEPIDVIIDWDLNMCRGTALKYISRAGRKDKNKEIEDLEKAIFYLKKEIETLKEKKRSENNA